MNKNFRALVLLPCLAAAAVGSAHATTILVTLDSNWADYHQYSYTDTDGNSQSAPTGPYQATFTGGSFGVAAAYLFCLDFHIDTNIGQVYSGYLVYPTTQADIESAYLENKVLQGGGYNADVQSLSGPVALAVWYLENPSSANPAPFPVDPKTAALVTEAQNAYLNGTWTASMASGFPMWIPDVLTSSQRFGVMSGPVFSTGDVDPAVPEPSSGWLFGGASLLLFLSWKLHLIHNGRNTP